MMRKEKRSGSNGFRTGICRQWLFSYLVIFCLPLAAYLLISFFTLGIIRKQTHDLNERALNMTMLAVDQQVEAIEAIATEIVSSRLLGELMSMDSNSGEKEYRLLQLKNELATMVSRNSLIEKIYIYMYDEDYIISDETKAKLAYYYENECSELSMSGQEWRNILRTPHLREYKIWENNSSRPTLMFMVSVPLFEGAPKATICIKLSSWKFWRVVEENRDMAMAVYDGQNAQLYSSGDGLQVEPVTLKSDTTSWRYEAYIEDAVLNAQEGYAKLLIIIGIVLVLSIGITLILLNIKRNYNPIRGMITQFEKIFDKRSEGMEELPYIEKSLKLLGEELQEKQREMKEHVRLMSRAYLICILMGQCPKNVSITEEMRLLGFEELTRFCVLILESGREETVESAAELLSIGSQETCLYFGCGVELNGRIVFVIDSESGDEESRGKLNERLLEEVPGAKLAWSGAYEGGRNLHYAYDEAQYILHSTCSSADGVLTLTRVQEERDRQVQIPPELKNELFRVIQNGEAERIENCIREIWNSNTVSLVNTKVVAAAIYNQVLELRHTHQGIIFPSEMLTFYNIQVRARSSEEVFRILCTAVRQAADQMNGREVSRDEQLVNRMKQYIDEHYADVLLSVDSLCRAFDRSPSGVNKAFKEVTGQGPLYYINYRRIQEAKRIFVESAGECPAGSVLKMVGYTNLNTFTRAFKRNEGITPGQFKETVLQANQHRTE